MKFPPPGSAVRRLALFLLLAGFVTSFLLIKNFNAGDVLIEKKEKGSRATDAAKAEEFILRMTRDIRTGKIPADIRARELAQVQGIFARQSEAGRILVNNYSLQGPDNLGGRTRAVAYDVRWDGGSNQVILAGGVSGGLFKSTDNGATWVRKSPINDLFSVTSIAQDPRPGFEDTWYYATGEHLGNSAGETGSFYFGHGIYKSTDNGESWTRLTSSNGGSLEVFDARQDLISKVTVDPANGNVYMGAMDAIYRSTDGGASWNVVITSGDGTISTSFVSDIVVTSGGRLYAAFSGQSNTGPTNDMPGVWTSTSGASGTWTKIGGDNSATNPAGWNADGTYGRVVLAIAPSSENILYALYWNGTENICPTANKEAELFRWDMNTSTWTDLSANLPDEPGCSDGNDPFAVQSGYDLIVSVKPDNANVVFIGGTNLYRSTDGFTSTANTTRIGGYATSAGYAMYANSHPDIHAIAFQPGDPSVMICGNDGGIQRTNDDLAATVAWTPINNGYVTFQYYYVTVDPRSGNTKVLGGAQDNGTTRNNGGAGTSFELVFSGDGGSVGLSDDIGGNTYEYCASQLGNIYRRNSLSGPNFGTFIRPAAAVNGGLFITLFRLDPDNTELLYYANENTLYRNTSASTATTGNWTDLTGVATEVGGAYITSLATTRGTYNASSSSLFIGTDDGRILRLDDPQNAAAVTAPVDITNGGLPPGAFISSISVNPRNDDTVLVTISNYGTNNIFWTGNANTATPAWLNVEGDLTEPSVRSSVIAITDAGVEYFVGTSVGLFTTTIDGANPLSTTWTQDGASDIGNAVVSSLALRTSDNTLVAGTHGYGMWRTQLTMGSLPVTMHSFTGKVLSTYNELEWETSNEKKNKGFEVQRKYTGDVDFVSIGFVKAKNISGNHIYRFKDMSVDMGRKVAYYRLKQVDIDDKHKYSQVLALGRKPSTKLVEYLSVSGNSLYLRINNGNGNLNMQIRIFDMNGKMVRNLHTKYQTQELDISTLARGTYVVEVIGRNKQRVTQKIFR